MAVTKTYWILVGIVAVVLITGCSSVTIDKKTDFEVIAHRGLHQHYDGDGKDKVLFRDFSCEASRMLKPTHNYIENTIKSIDAAFSYGATIVEIDIRRTKDNHLVVFHDYYLECKTNGKGHIWDFSLEYLKSLDVGYRYTSDGGKTYPFRGQGVGEMPTLIEVLRKFPDKKFLIDHKNGAMEKAKLLVDVLMSLPVKQRKRIYVWASDEIYEYMKNEVPLVTRLFLPRNHQKKWFISYLLKFGFGAISEEYKGQGLGVPAKYTKYIWGWPNRFLAKVYDAGARFYLFVDTEEEMAIYSDTPLDGIVTDYIEVFGRNHKNLTRQIHSDG